MSELYYLSFIENEYNKKYDAFCENHHPDDIYEEHKTNDNSLNNYAFFNGNSFKDYIDYTFSEIKKALEEQSLTHVEIQSIKKLLGLLSEATTTNKIDDLRKQLPIINEEAMSIQKLGLTQRLTSALKSLVYAIRVHVFSFSFEKTDYHSKKTKQYFNEAISGERKHESKFISQLSSHASSLFDDLSHIRNIEQYPEKYSKSTLTAYSLFNQNLHGNRLPSLAQCQKSYEELENTLSTTV
tara:strand:- start:2911 stop:3630 length:720 start_codon:yes stop_codon:yes gene_type:complete